MKSNDIDLIDQIDFFEYIKRIETYKLVGVIEDLEDLEEASEALIELSDRNKEKMIELGGNILTNGLGDVYLQGFTFKLIYNSEPNAAVGLVKDRISAIAPILLRDIMDELANDCFQDIAKEIPVGLLRSIKERYMILDKEDKESIAEEYRRFELAYKGILY